ncbi:LacI family transcriptional regulator [Virgibacillus natechei]|uniref:LacI family transcriptional regulator n=1 Tax=Virgibacillus natechei TaxID=1216297 RepID=A0ABS4IGH5_9BACI|nr:LacI family DNA-binding transcriptional regulator [Virgibacillus natechei]MBP1970038.1 LacI family transcriptional regulator [Virgibacillus natechei]UZD14124.1 LacI family transcriptional regulator [Virgibacillus natechei]
MVSSKDVAKEAGVSQPTVSRVLNSPTKVNKETLNKVQKAMKKLNYRPNLVARSLKQQKTEYIALISGPLHNPFFVDSTTAIVNYAKEQGYHTLVYFEDQGDNLSVYEEVLKQQVDGIILSSIFVDDPIYDELVNSKVPFVMFNRRYQSEGNYVEVNNKKAGKLAADHLLELGHSKIAWIGGPTYASTFQGRLEGYQEAMETTNHPVNQAWVKETNTTEESVVQAVKELLLLEDRPTAIFAATDSIALHCQNYLLQMGYQIPEHFSICGMDDIGITAHKAIQMTTLSHESDKPMGMYAIEQLIHLMKTESEEKRKFMQLTLEPKLIIRGTTGPNHS